MHNTSLHRVRENSVFPRKFLYFDCVLPNEFRIYLFCAWHRFSQMCIYLFCFAYIIASNGISWHIVWYTMHSMHHIISEVIKWTIPRMLFNVSVSCSLSVCVSLCCMRLALHACWQISYTSENKISMQVTT